MMNLTKTERAEKKLLIAEFEKTLKTAPAKTVRSLLVSLNPMAIETTKPKQIAQIVRILQKKTLRMGMNLHLMILGMIPKSQVARQMAKRMNLPVTELRISQNPTPDLFGVPVSTIPVCMLPKNMRIVAAKNPRTKIIQAIERQILKMSLTQLEILRIALMMRMTMVIPRRKTKENLTRVLLDHLPDTEGEILPLILCMVKKLNSLNKLERMLAA